MLHLEAGPFTDSYCQSVVALVTDQGTEHLISDAAPVQMDTIQQDDMQALGVRKGYAAAGSGGFLEDDDAVRPCALGAKEVIDLASDEEGELTGTDVRASLSTIPAMGPTEHTPESKTLPRRFFGQTKQF